MKQQPDRLADFLTITDAASYLGVSASTLRNWDRAGKLKARRHPINRYRLYVRADLDDLLVKVNGRRKR
ncbi:MAG: MerR family DNA-binding transcriptional regulator [Candidatus Binataceae bacterium]